VRNIELTSLEKMREPRSGGAQSSGNVFNLQRYSLHDGPGIRTTVFLKGCPASCWWCHNPESQLPGPEIAVSQTRCIACDACLLACHEGLQPRDKCILCGDCSQACPTGARSLVGRQMTVAEVVASVMRDRMFFEDSGGGVTFSGGEPLGQPEFLKALLAAFRALEIPTALDTAGFCPTEALLEVAPLVDLFLFDLKCIDEASHLRGTGVGNSGVLENLTRLSAVHHNIWIRVPVVPGFNDTTEEMQAIARVAAASGSVRQVWLLPFHATWAAKPERFGKETPGAAGLIPPSAERLERFARIFRELGLETIIGG
jgi:pyruvate formate lyase activating enzyme